MNSFNSIEVLAESKSKKSHQFLIYASIAITKMKKKLTTNGHLFISINFIWFYIF